MVASGKSFAGSVAVNMIHPLASTITVLILGRHSHADLACFGVVHSIMGFTTGIFSFLPTFVTSKVGKSVGSERWHRVGSHVRAALLSSLLVGCFSSLLLLFARSWLFEVLHVRRSQAVSVDGYYSVRLLALPTKIMCQTVGGVLAGYQRLNAAVVVVTVQSVLEVLGMYLIFEVWNLGLAHSGYTYLSASLVGTIVGLVLISALPPKAAVEGGHKIDVFTLPALPSLAPASDADESREEEEQESLPPTTAEMILAMESVPISPKPVAASLPSLSLAPPAAAAAASIVPPFRALSVSVGGAAADPAAAAANLPPDTPVREFRYVKANSLLHTFASFVADTGDMALRQVVLQASFFLASIACNRISPQYQAAFQIIERIWMLLTHFYHGFQTLNAMEGSKAIGAGSASAGRDLILLLWRTAAASTLVGVASGLLLWLLGPEICSLFAGAKDARMLAILLSVFPLMLWAKPLDSIGCAYDGMLYAAQSFVFMRNREVLGFVFLYLPLLALGYFYYESFVAIWAARAALYVWRAIVGVYHVHWKLVPHWKAADRFASPSDDAEDAALPLLPHHHHQHHLQHQLQSQSQGHSPDKKSGGGGSERGMSDSYLPLLQREEEQEGGLLQHRYGAVDDSKSPVGLP